MSDAAGWAWEVATDWRAVHNLLCASDRYHAATHGLQAPLRREATTCSLVQSRSVHVLQRDGVIAGMFTLTFESPFPLEDVRFPVAARPSYLRRLAVDPKQLPLIPTLGVRCVRRAIEVAQRQKSDALRAEANPDLTSSVALLTNFGFIQCGSVQSGDDKLRRIYVYKDLDTRQK